MKTNNILDYYDFLGVKIATMERGAPPKDMVVGKPSSPKSEPKDTGPGFGELYKHYFKQNYWEFPKHRVSTDIKRLKWLKDNLFTERKKSKKVPPGFLETALKDPYILSPLGALLGGGLVYGTSGDEDKEDRVVKSLLGAGSGALLGYILSKAFGNIDFKDFAKPKE